MASVREKRKTSAKRMTTDHTDHTEAMGRLIRVLGVNRGEFSSPPQSTAAVFKGLETEARGFSKPWKLSQFSFPRFGNRGSEADFQRIIF